MLPRHYVHRWSNIRKQRKRKRKPAGLTDDEIAFFKEIKREHAYFEKAKRNREKNENSLETPPDLPARNRLVENNQGLVYDVVISYWQRFRNANIERTLSFDDLIQEGALGLMRAARKFDWKMGCRFSTYAVDWISNHVERALYRHGHPLKISPHALTQMSKYQRALGRFQQQHNRPPLLEERLHIYHHDLTAKSKPSFSILELAAKHAQSSTFSLTTEERSDGAGGFEELPDPHTIGVTPADEASQREFIERLRHYLSSLPIRHRRVLELRYLTINRNSYQHYAGYPDGLVFVKIARVLAQERLGTGENGKGVMSRERVRQIVREAIRTLRSRILTGKKQQGKPYAPARNRQFQYY